MESTASTPLALWLLLRRSLCCSWRVEDGGVVRYNHPNCPEQYLSCDWCLPQDFPVCLDRLVWFGHKRNFVPLPMLQHGGRWFRVCEHIAGEVQESRLVRLLEHKDIQWRRGIHAGQPENTCR
jgi:hypothetical protein